MKRVYQLAVCTALIAAMPVNAAPHTSGSPTFDNDAQCLLLYLAAAGGDHGEETRQAAIIGSWYFLGKLDVSTPGLNLAQLLRDKADVLEGNPRAEEIGKACDAELSKRGQDLMNAGKQFEGAPPQSSSSS